MGIYATGTAIFVGFEISQDKALEGKHQQL